MRWRANKIPKELINIFIEKFGDEIDNSSKDCLEWKGSIKNGYGTISFKRKTYIVSRVAFSSKNPLGERELVLHSCDNPSCFNPKHLRKGTAKENTKDSHDRKRSRFHKYPKCMTGSNHHSSKLNENDILKIRKLLCKNISQNKIAKLFDVDQSTISYINMKKTWRHV